MKRWLVAVVVALVLVVPVPASAECAWVLWQKVGERELVNAAMTTSDSCQAAVADRLQRAQMLGYEVISHEPGRGVYRDPKDGFVSWRCLPNTVDPRGPKTN